MLHLYAAQAEKERRVISARTKDALRTAKARGVKLGWHGAEHLSVQNKATALERAKSLAPLRQPVHAPGLFLQALSQTDLGDLQRYRNQQVASQALHLLPLNPCP